MQRYLTVLLFLYAFDLCAQKPVYLRVEFAGASTSRVARDLDYASFHSDTLSLAEELRTILIRLNEASFLAATFTEFRNVSDTLIALIDPGKSYEWIRLGKGNVPEDLLSAAGFRENQFAGKPFSPGQYARRAERVLQTLENAGYPFASLTLDSVRIDSSGISASWNLERNVQVFFDTLEVIGDANVKKWYLSKYLGIKTGNPYNEQLVKAGDSRLSQLPFLRTTRNTYVYFYGSKARPILYLDNRKASSVDGIIGFAPNAQSSNGALLITGEANLRLQNLFATGKSLDINYRSFLGNSQDLKIRIAYPYIFRTQLAFDYELALLKQDTTFLDIRNEFGLQYRFIGTDYIKFFYGIQTTTLITVDTNQVKATRALPTSSDIRNDQYGLSLKVTRYDYFLNPRRGGSIELTASIGNKKIVRNPTINAIRFPGEGGAMVSIYDTIQLSMVQYRFMGNADYFIPFFSRATGRIQLMGGHIQSPNLFFNELFRIGGIRTLKGFDEQSIFANTYMILNTEVRYLLQQNSNIILFWNGAYYRNDVRKPALTDRPSGFGAGMNFETGAGIFSIFYAVGSAFGSSFDFNQAKVHFGFVNYF